MGKILQVRISNTLYDQLTEEATRIGLGHLEVVRMAISEWLQRNEMRRGLVRAELSVRDEHTTADCALPASSVSGVGAGR